MKYCQLGIFPESEIEIEIQPKVTLEMARRSIKSQVRSLSRHYEIPDYLIHLALVLDYIDTYLDLADYPMYLSLFLSKFVHYLEPQNNTFPIAPIDDGDRSDYINQFAIGDLIKFRAGYRSNLEHEYTIGVITEDLGHSFSVTWRLWDIKSQYTKNHIALNQLWIKVSTD